MYENLVGQQAKDSLIADIEKNVLPGSVLFSGNDASGKLTAALETARVLSCHESGKKMFNCTCPSCLRHKSLLSTNLVLCGPRDCFLEISAASDSFLRALQNRATYLDATRYLFLRSVRKLTLRFSDVLLEGDDKINKIGVSVSAINEMLEELDFPRPLSEFDDTVKLIEKIKDACLKLETDFLYDSIPINQIRNVETWARMKNDEGKKTVIIENADRMLENVRNALLKILEEPPSDTVFILLTSRRNAVMPTILSRVRTYAFGERSREKQSEVIDRVFHNPQFNGSLNEYLLTFLPVTPNVIRDNAKNYVKMIAAGTVPEISEIIKNCGGFDPRIELKLFLNGINSSLRKLFYSERGTQALSEISVKIQECWNNVTIYNQGPQAALENLFRELLKINVTNGNVFRCVDL